MKSYLLKIDGYTVGVVDLYQEEEKELNKEGLTASTSGFGGCLVASFPKI